MTRSLQVFERRINMDFFRCKNKKALFGNLRSLLRKILLNYPEEEYIMKYLEMISEEMPLHAAVSAGYFQMHKCIPDKISEFRTELRQKTEEKFIYEVESETPDTERCAELHAAFCYLDPENKSTAISEAVEKLDETYRELLFGEVGKCIHAVHDISQEERDLLDPVLKYFSSCYPEEINGMFLEKNEERFSDLVPRDKTIGELLINAVKKNYFTYFRILYTMFPGWHMNQNEISSGDFIDLCFEYTQNSDQILNLLYAGLQLAKKGHSYYTIKQIREWYECITSRENQRIRQAVSFIYYSHCIDTDPENAAAYVSEMPDYTPDSLFSFVLPLHTNPIGCTFVQNNVDTLLRTDSLQISSYIKKLGANNSYIYRTETESYAPDERIISRSGDYCELIRNAAWNFSERTFMFIFFNSHLKTIVSPSELWKSVSGIYTENAVRSALFRYLFSGTIRHVNFRFPDGMLPESNNINEFEPAYYSVYVPQLCQSINIPYIGIRERDQDAERFFENRKVRFKFVKLSSEGTEIRKFFHHVFFTDYLKLETSAPYASDQNISCSDIEEQNADGENAVSDKLNFDFCDIKIMFSSEECEVLRSAERKSEQILFDILMSIKGTKKLSDHHKRFFNYYEDIITPVERDVTAFVYLCEDDTDSDITDISVKISLWKIIKKYDFEKFSLNKVMLEKLFNIVTGDASLCEIFDLYSLNVFRRNFDIYDYISLRYKNSKTKYIELDLELSGIAYPEGKYTMNLIGRNGVCSSRPILVEKGIKKIKFFNGKTVKVNICGYNRDKQYFVCSCITLDHCKSDEILFTPLQMLGFWNYSREYRRTVKNEGLIRQGDEYSQINFKVSLKRLHFICQEQMCSYESDKYKGLKYRGFETLMSYYLWRCDTRKHKGRMKKFYRIKNYFDFDENIDLLMPDISVDTESFVLPVVEGLVYYIYQKNEATLRKYTDTFLKILPFSDGKMKITNIKRHFDFEVTNQYHDAVDLEKVLVYLVKFYSAQLIKEVYVNSPFRFIFSLNKLFATAVDFHKYHELLYAFSDFEVSVSSIPVPVYSQENWHDRYRWNVSQNVFIEEYLLLGTSARNRFKDMSVGKEELPSYLFSNQGYSIVKYDEGSKRIVLRQSSEYQIASKDKVEVLKRTDRKIKLIKDNICSKIAGSLHSIAGALFKSSKEK